MMNYVIAGLRKLSLIMMILMTTISVTNAQPVLDIGSSLGFDYTNTDYTAFGINSFEVQYNGGNWTSLGNPPVYSNVNGVTTYMADPQLPPGTHNVAFRACNTVECSDASSLFIFTVPDTTPPDPPDPPDPLIVEIQATFTNNRCLDVSGESTADGAAIIIWVCHKNRNQQFRIEPTDSGYNRIVSSLSGKCLDVTQWSMADGALVNQWACNDGANQQWRVEQNGNGYRFVARHSNKCLDVPGWSSANGTQTVQWTCNNGANQRWFVNEQ